MLQRKSFTGKYEFMETFYFYSLFALHQYLPGLASVHRNPCHWRPTNEPLIFFSFDNFALKSKFNAIKLFDFRPFFGWIYPINEYPLSINAIEALIFVNFNYRSNAYVHPQIVASKFLLNSNEMQWSPFHTMRHQELENLHKSDAEN